MTALCHVGNETRERTAGIEFSPVYVATEVQEVRS